ncbi:MAG: MarR family winged helix-turn-helix transcriptional regulator [Acholeplasma sp.]|jgi:DNA-binding MarR family transcriptional regulator|nr:MarR family winged helix-turn-helix transcriptional regulator [Acholeplasma sp.]
MQPNRNDKDLSRFPVVLGKIMKKLHSFPDPVLEKYQLSRIHVHYLVHLEGCHQKLNAKGLSDALGVDKANTSRALQDLINQGYVTKTDADIQNVLALTAKGKVVAQELKAQNKLEMMRLLSVLSDEERESLKSILTKISKQL